ncbi:MAG: response regulator [Chloroflexi bacterium]|nr:response regulator [Chloroflexota bacterium]
MLRADIRKYARILIIDDEEPNALLLQRALQRAGYTLVQQSTDPRQAVLQYAEFRPDLILLDLHMPHVDGFTLLERFHSLIPEGSYLPILVLTADITPEAKQRALGSGARDFLTKPFDLMEVLLRVDNLLETRFLHLQLQSQNRLLEERVWYRTRELEESQAEILERLALAAEYRDDETGRHTQRVGQLAAVVAAQLGLPGDQVELLRLAAPLHDVGKIGVPDVILRKPGKLTPEEFAVVKTHTTVGARILAGGRSDLVQLAETIALAHHERWDGTGYPQGLKGDDIPLLARIVTVADVYDALIYERPYKAAWPLQEALAEIERQKGRQFDPQVVDAFQQVVANGVPAFL